LPESQQRFQVREFSHGKSLREKRNHIQLPHHFVDNYGQETPVVLWPEVLCHYKLTDSHIASPRTDDKGWFSKSTYSPNTATRSQDADSFYETKMSWFTGTCVLSGSVADNFQIFS